MTAQADNVDELYSQASLDNIRTPSATDPSRAERPLEALVRRIGSMPLKFEPGFGFEYSIGHIVLGDVIETLCQESLGVALQRLVFDPLGIKTARFFEIPEYVLESSTRPSTFVPVETTLELGDRGLVMSVRDTYTLLSSINPFDKRSIKLLSEETLDLGLAPQYSCSSINDIAVTRIEVFNVMTNWCLLGSLYAGGFMSSGMFGVLAATDHDGNLKLMVQDQLLFFWDMNQALAIMCPKAPETKMEDEATSVHLTHNHRRVDTSVICGVDTSTTEKTTAFDVGTLGLQRSHAEDDLAELFALEANYCDNEDYAQAAEVKMQIEAIEASLGSTSCQRDTWRLCCTLTDGPADPRWESYFNDSHVHPETATTVLGRIREDLNHFEARHPQQPMSRVQPEEVPEALKSDGICFVSMNHEQIRDFILDNDYSIYPTPINTERTKDKEFRAANTEINLLAVNSTISVHTEGHGYVSVAPDVVVFHCSSIEPQQWGETAVIDLALMHRLLPCWFIQKFGDRRVSGTWRYKKHNSPGPVFDPETFYYGWADVFAETKEDTGVLLEAVLPNCTYEWEGDELLVTYYRNLTYTIDGVSYWWLTDPNFILEGINEVIIGERTEPFVFTEEAKKHTRVWNQGEHMFSSEERDVLLWALLHAMRHRPWAVGDTVVVDNTKFAHTRLNCEAGKRRHLDVYDLTSPHSLWSELHGQRSHPTRL